MLGSSGGCWARSVHEAPLSHSSWSRHGLMHALKMWTSQIVRDGICVDPPLCRGSSQGKYGSCVKGVGCEGESVGKIGEVCERELVLVVSVRCGKERDMTGG